jgi:hypothetical protein
VAPEHAEKLRDILGALDMSRVLQDMNLPGFKASPAKGQPKGSLCGIGVRKLARYFPLREW